MKNINHILIVGGGTAGWLTAAYLAKALKKSPDTGMHITLVESKEIGTIGVGEGSFPSIRTTLATIGIDEARFIRECNATFKQGIQFVDWVRPKDTTNPTNPDHYFHPFSVPNQRPGGPELLPYWLRGVADKSVGYKIPFAKAVTLQSAVVDAAHGPKRFTDPDYMGPMNYAYHFDAAKLAILLASHAKSLGVKHLYANVEQVKLDEEGAIASIVTPEHGELTADLYLDCSGFRAKMIGEALGSPYRNLNDILFVDRALAIQVPYRTPESAIPSCTISTAHDAGWTWDIGLQQRRGVGYVFSSRHSDERQAEQTLRNYLHRTNGTRFDDMDPRLLKLNVGYREVQWIKNCVAVGLSAGFLEPLESSGLGLVETAAYLIAHLFPHDGNLAPAAKLFNSMMKERFERIVNFIKLHYCLTQRTDTQFWIDNADPQSVPDVLQQQLAMWRCRPPHRLDFVADLEMYPPASWQFVLYGMEFATDVSNNHQCLSKEEEASKEFLQIQRLGAHVLTDLPTHRNLINHFCAAT